MLKSKPSAKRLLRVCLTTQALLAVLSAHPSYAQPVGSMHFSYQAPLSKLQSRRSQPIPESQALDNNPYYLPTVVLSPAFVKLPNLETRLLGHSYPTQEVPTRLDRLEHLLFGSLQLGTLESRMSQIAMRVRENSERRAQSTHEPMVTYMENRLFQRTYENKPLPDRLKQLEMQVFGVSFDNYPNAIRLKKLTYAVPLNSGELRLSHAGDNDLIATTHNKKRPDQVPHESTLELFSAPKIAETPVASKSHSPETPNPAKSYISKSTRQKSPPLPQVATLEATELPHQMTLQLSRPSRYSPAPYNGMTANALAANDMLPTPTLPVTNFAPSKMEATPPEVTPSSGYFASILRQPNGSILRWATMPVRIFSKGGVGQESNLAAALKAWQPSIDWLVVSDIGDCDIIVSWDEEDWLQNTHGFLVRPVAQMNKQQKLRTVLMLTFFPLIGQSTAQRQHTMIHVLGHSLGLWGHSDQSQDMLYPLYSQENTDFPAGWAGAQVNQATASQPAAGLPTTLSSDIFNGGTNQPSRNDFATLQAVYQAPASNISLQPLSLRPNPMPPTNP